MATRTQIRFKLLIVIAAAAFLTAETSPSFARIEPEAGGVIRALILGIDGYRSRGVRQLSGAANDAKDLRDSLLKAGAKPENIIFAVDERIPDSMPAADRAKAPVNVTRSKFEGWMRQLISAATPKDLVVISFAGHGTRVKEMTPHSKPDGKDEAYLLTQFDEKSSVGELVRGPEMQGWLKSLDDRGVNVIFIADTCHAGGLTRDIDPRASQLEYRYQPVNIDAYLEDKLPNSGTPENSNLSEASYRNLTFLAAVDQFSKAPEVQIGNKKRGALSYAMGRIFEGTAKITGGSIVTRRALFEYARQIAAQYTESRQILETSPKRDDMLDVPVFSKQDEAPAPAPAAEPIKVAVINGDQSLLQGLPTNTYPFALVADKDAASLVWDAAAKEALFGQDVIARNVEAADIPNVVASIGALAELKRMSEANSTTFRLLPNNQIHREGETVTLDAPEINDNYLIVFDLTGDGTLQVLYPFTKEEKASPKVSEGWHIDNKVQEPYGADSVVVISSPVALLDLQNALISRNNTKFAGKLIETIKYYTGTRQNIKIGITKLVTAPRS